MSFSSGSYKTLCGLRAALSLRMAKAILISLSPPLFCLPLDKLDEILAAAQQTISASESPGPGGLASLGKHRPKGFFATEVGGLVWGIAVLGVGSLMGA